MSYIEITALLLVCCIGLSEQIKCYKCISSPDIPVDLLPFADDIPPCPEDESMDKTLVECGAGVLNCDKYDISMGGLTASAKTCGQNDTNNLCAEVNASPGRRQMDFKIKCNYCQGDGCNSSSATVISLFTVTSAFAIVKYVM